MNEINNLIGKEVLIEISGNTLFNGILIDIGLDLLVLFNGKKFLYIPLTHLHNMKVNPDPEITTEAPSMATIEKNMDTGLAYRKILNNSKGRFLEIFVTGNRSIHEVGSSHVVL